MTPEQHDRAEHLRIRAVNLSRELSELESGIEDLPPNDPSILTLITAIQGATVCQNALLNLVDRTKLPRGREATLNPFDSLHAAICTTSRDMSAEKLDAWIYGVVVGWSQEAMLEVGRDFRWNEETQARLRHLHEAFNDQKDLHKS